MQDSRGFVWITYEITTGFLSRLDTATGQFTHWKTVSGGIDSTNPYACWGLLYEDRTGTVYFGSGKEILKFDAGTKSFFRLARFPVPISEIPRLMFEDSSSNLWLSFQGSGLLRYHKPSSTSELFTANEDYRTAFVRSNGEIVLGGVGNVTVFHPDSLRPSAFIPNIVLTAFSVFDKSIVLSEDSVNYKTITMPHDSNFFAFEFASLDLTAPERNQHAYKLEGYEDNWNYAGNKREAKYTKVPRASMCFA